MTSPHAQHAAAFRIEGGPPHRPPRAKVSRKGWIVIICAPPAVLLAAIGLGLIGRVAGPAPTTDDVKIVGCTSAGSPGLYTLEATVGIVNTRSTSMDYVVTVAFTNGDGSMQLDTATASARDLQPGQSAAPNATALVTTAPPSDMKCTVLRVTRL